MNFNNLIMNYVWPLFKENGFNSIEEKNIVTFKSNKVEIRFTFDQFENTYSIYIGKTDSLLYQLNSFLAKKIFNINLDISSQNDFVDKILLILNHELGQDILKGNIDLIIDESINQIADYNIELQKKQILSILSKNWNDKDYNSFLKNVKKININELPKAFIKKIEIATRNLKK